jgi:hypothetical protein
MVSNLKSEMDDLMSSKDFLNIFERKRYIRRWCKTNKKPTNFKMIPEHPST